MPIAIRAGQGLNQQGLNRRQLLVRSAATVAVGGLGSIARPYLSRAADRPAIACGIQSGDVSADSAVIWARADRPSRMQVEYSLLENFRTIIGSSPGEARPGRFRTAPSGRDSVSFVWSGDTLGQGWGIDPSRGGLRTYRTMHNNRPDFFIHCGDHIYADCPVEPELKLPNGEIWRNIVT